MSVSFDYTTLLKNSYHIERAKLAALVTSTTEDDYYPEWESDTIVNPNSAIFFYSIVNSGHAGTTTLIEYHFHVIWDPTTAGASTLAYNWQIKASGGAWADIVTGSVVSANGEAVAVKDTSVYDTPVLLPAEIRLIGTDADATWFVKLGHGATDYTCAVRAIGTV